ncbi:hypothetical protein Misp01_62660 [Microtetraspora sp. NBRC 13810]|uniref:hypothetical protein n=1 Tax=Microtetraspora sp. NBRC 13810 TaxID=3030990 RepID=UPI0024A483E2|nr:hypothetical protein [Microtetraspora sp. NBRC 13810]GLW11138.1 hypothetical protein Misp01_62660 [Microtetraspora sp. NBRC 13810]
MTPDEEALHLNALDQTFPAWRFTVLGGGWWATKVDPPTEKERAEGIHAQIRRDHPHALVSALARQQGILSARRGICV